MNHFILVFELYSMLFQTLLNQHQTIIPPTKERLIMAFPDSMVHCVLLTAGSKSKRHDLVIPPSQIHPTMHLHQQIHEKGYKNGPSQDVTANDVQREVGEQNQGDSLDDRQLIRDLRIDLGVGVVRMMDTP